MPRLFYASFPDRELKERLSSLQRELKLPGRPTSGERLHLTLLFLGEVADELVHPLKERTTKLLSILKAPEEPVVVRFDRLEHWPKPKVVCLVPSEVPEPLFHLHRALRKASRRFELQLEERPFRPHVTLARKVHRRFPNRELEEPILWPLSEVVLVSSKLLPEGPLYETVARWPCRHGASPPSAGPTTPPTPIGP